MKDEQGGSDEPIVLKGDYLVFQAVSLKDFYDDDGHTALIRKGQHVIVVSFPEERRCVVIPDFNEQGSSFRCQGEEANTSFGRKILVPDMAFH